MAFVAGVVPTVLSNGGFAWMQAVPMKGWYICCVFGWVPWVRWSLAVEEPPEGMHAWVSCTAAAWGLALECHAA